MPLLVFGSYFSSCRWYKCVIPTLLSIIPW